MAVNIGSAALQRSYVGDQEVKRIYVGGKYAWPSVPSAKVEWIGSAVASGATNTFPAHEPGDLLVVVAVETGAASRPSLAAGFTEVHANTSGMSICIGYRIATSSSTPVGTWTNAFYNTAYVFRYANTNTPFGGLTSMIDTKGISPSITMQNTSGDSALVYGFSNNGTVGGWGGAPDGFITKNGVARMGNLQKIVSTSDGAVTWSSTAGTVNFRNWVFEVLPEEPVVEEPPYLYGVDIVYKPNYVVEFTVKKGLPYDPNSDEAFMFRCAQMPKDGYTGRTFSKQWSANGYSALDCTLQDLWGDGVPANNDTMMKTISFQITPRA